MELVRTESVEKTHGPQFRLGPLDISLNRGESLGVVGQCGAGKTTLLQLIWGFLRPDRGNIRVFHQPPHLHQLAVRMRTGFLRASPCFNESLSARRHLQFVAEFYCGCNDAASTRLLRRFDLNPDTPVYQLTATARLKLALVAALAHEPELVLLDEPFAGLGSADRAEICALLSGQTRKHGCSIILTARDAGDVAGVADTILRL